MHTEKSPKDDKRRPSHRPSLGEHCISVYSFTAEGGQTSADRNHSWDEVGRTTETGNKCPEVKGVIWWSMYYLSLFSPESKILKELLLKETVTIAFIAHFLFKNIRHKLWGMELSSGGRGTEREAKWTRLVEVLVMDSLTPPVLPCFLLHGGWGGVSTRAKTEGTDDSHTNYEDSFQHVSPAGWLEWPGMLVN